MIRYKSNRERIAVFVGIVGLMLLVSFLPAMKSVHAQSSFSNFTCGAAPGGGVVNGTIQFDTASGSPIPGLGDTIFAAARVQSAAKGANHVTCFLTLKDPNGIVVGSVSKTFYLAKTQNGQLQLCVALDCAWPAGLYTYTLTVTAGNGVCGVYSAGGTPPVAVVSVYVQPNGLCGL